MEASLCISPQFFGSRLRTKVSSITMKEKIRENQHLTSSHLFWWGDILPCPPVPELKKHLAHTKRHWLFICLLQCTAADELQYLCPSQLLELLRSRRQKISLICIPVTVKLPHVREKLFAVVN